MESFSRVTYLLTALDSAHCYWVNASGVNSTTGATGCSQTEPLLCRQRPLKSQYLIPAQPPILQAGSGESHCRAGSATALSTAAALCPTKTPKQTLLNNVTGDLITEPRFLKYRTGSRQKSWHKNCVALGLASGFIEPLESTSIHLVMTAIIRLIRLFPFGESKEALADRFNQETRTEIETVRDFVILALQANQSYRQRLLECLPHHGYPGYPCSPTRDFQKEWLMSGQTMLHCSVSIPGCRS